jgi:hypothetical protein
LRQRHLLIVGAQRCGTTFLAASLDAHPDITMARPSRPEPKVFISPVLSARGQTWYDATFFAHATTERILGDKSTSYLEDPAAAGRAAAMLPDALVLAQLRDPVARAVSNWQFSTDNGLERRPLTEALRENVDRSQDWDPSATSVSPYAYLERGRYCDYLEPWFGAFPGGVRVQFLEELVDSLDVTRDLCAWLGVASDQASRSPLPRVNASSDPAPPIDAALEADLRAYFSQSDDRLATLLGRQPPWARG